MAVAVSPDNGCVGLSRFFTVGRKQQRQRRRQVVMSVEVHGDEMTARS